MAATTKRFENGVQWYTRGQVVLDIGFPENWVCCRFCPYVRSTQGGIRHECVLTGDVLYDVDGRGDGCPIKELKEDEH